MMMNLEKPSRVATPPLITDKRAPPVIALNTARQNPPRDITPASLPLSPLRQRT